MNITPEMGDRLNTIMADIQSPDQSMTLGLMDIVSLWPKGKDYLATTTAEQVLIEFKGYQYSKTMIANLRDALSGLILNTTVKSESIKCTQMDEMHEWHSSPNGINIKADVNIPYEEIVRAINEIDEIPENNLQYFEAKIISNDLPNKIFTGYLEYAANNGTDNKTIVTHKAYLLEIN